MRFAAFIALVCVIAYIFIYLTAQNHSYEKNNFSTPCQVVLGFPRP